MSSSESKKHTTGSTNPLTGSLTFSSLKPLDLNNFTKDDVRAYFNNSYDLYETLFTSLKQNSVYYLCPDRLRLPLVFYYGHTAAVFVNKLVLSGLVHVWNKKIFFAFSIKKKLLTFYSFLRFESQANESILTMILLLRPEWMK
jgi:hypothetical protein